MRIGAGVLPGAIPLGDAQGTNVPRSEKCADGKFHVKYFDIRRALTATPRRVQKRAAVYIAARFAELDDRFVGRDVEQRQQFGEPGFGARPQQIDVDDMSRAIVE